MARVPVRFICLMSCFSNFTDPMARRRPRRFSCKKAVTVRSKFSSVNSNTLTSSSRVCLRSKSRISVLLLLCISCLMVSLPFSLALRFLYITWLRISVNIARPISAMIANVPPKWITIATKKQMVNAAPAVMNQPPITLSTPVIRNTAESRPQARSASEVPMATMNVT